MPRSPRTGARGPSRVAPRPAPHRRRHSPGGEGRITRRERGLAGTTDVYAELPSPGGRRSAARPFGSRTHRCVRLTSVSQRRKDTHDRPQFTACPARTTAPVTPCSTPRACSPRWRRTASPVGSAPTPPRSRRGSRATILPLDGPGPRHVRVGAGALRRARPRDLAGLLHASTAALPRHPDPPERQPDPRRDARRRHRATRGAPRSRGRSRSATYLHHVALDDIPDGAGLPPRSHRARRGLR